MNDIVKDDAYWASKKKPEELSVEEALIRNLYHSLVGKRLTEHDRKVMTSAAVFMTSRNVGY